MDQTAFVFPVAGLPRSVTTADPQDGGVREFAVLSDLMTAYPLDLESAYREGMLLVDAEGNSWEILSIRSEGLAGDWGERTLRRIFRRPKYKVAYEFAPREPVPFDQVKARYYAALRANREAHVLDGIDWAPTERWKIRYAKNLRDLIKNEEQLAIERWRQPSPIWARLLWLDRAGRREFMLSLVVAGVSAKLLLELIGRMEEPPAVLIVALFLLSSFLVLSAVARRLHDFGLSAWCALIFWAWSMALALPYQYLGSERLNEVLTWLWVGSTVFCLLGLALWPGMSRFNDYGPARAHRAKPSGI